MESASSDYRLMLGPRAESAEAYCALGVNAAIRSLADQAERAFRKAITLKPDYHWAHYCLGVVLSEAGRHSDAIAELETAVRGLPGNLRVARALGKAWIAGGDGAQAIAIFKDALADNPNSAEASALHQEMAGAYYAEGRFSEASREFEMAIEARPRAPYLRVNLGASYLAQGDAERAAAQFRKALEINPRLVSALRNLGTLHLKAGQIDDAITALETAVSVDPSHPITLRKLAFAYLEKGDKARAELSMRQAMEMEGRT